MPRLAYLMTAARSFWLRKTRNQLMSRKNWRGWFLGAVTVFGGSRCGLLVSAAPPRSDLSRVCGPQNILRHPQLLERVLQSLIRAGRSFWTAYVLSAGIPHAPLGI